VLTRFITWVLGKFPNDKDLDCEENFVANTYPSGYDERDYSPSVSTTASIYQDIEILPRPPIRNQHSIGSCASHAVLRSLEIQFMAKNRYLELSELYHYYNARKHVNLQHPADKGMTIRDACKTCDHYGNAPELTWPYVISKYNDEPALSAYWLSNIFEVDRYERLDTVVQIKQSLLEGIPVICGIFLDAAYFKLRTSFWDPERRYTEFGAHAVLIVGWKEEEQRLVFDNSWGISWGYHGKFEMSVDAFRKVGFDYFRVIAKHR
jgi:C1A family cysteine protease